jgi:mannosyltransferase OCH1-like enzyme
MSFLSIIDKNIDVDLFQDSRKDAECKHIGYDKLEFKYSIETNYTNTSILQKNIHFIWIGSTIKDKYIHTIINCKKINSIYNVYLWIDNRSVNESIQNILENNNIIIKNVIDDLNSNEITFNIKNNEIINYLNTFPNYGYKADILRLYIVYKYGGIYSDIDSIWIKPLDNNFNYEFVTYRIDKQCSNITNSFFGFNNNSFIIKNIIDNLKLSIECFIKTNNYYLFHKYIPLISGPEHLTRIIRDLNLQNINYIHQGYCVIGGPHEELYSNYSKENKVYCYQTFDKNWC